MTAPLKAIDGTDDLAALMHDIGRRAKAAARVLAQAPAEQKDRALAAIAKALRADAAAIIAANAEDVAEARANDITAAFLDRLTLDAKRVESMAAAIDTIRDIPDPVGQVTERWTRPNGMTIERVRVPLGVVGVIFESRPNVAADAGALCLKAGNAVILRGGSDSFRSCRAIHASIARGLARGEPARGRDHAGADARPRGGRPDACGPRRRNRRDRAARRQEPGRARAGRGARAGVRASGRHVPRLCRPRRRSRHGEEHRGQREDAAHRRLRRGRDAAGGSRSRKDAPQAAGRGADRRGLRSARRRGNAGGGRARKTCDRRGLVDRISRRDHRRESRRRRR